MPDNTARGAVGNTHLADDYEANDRGVRVQDDLVINDCDSPSHHKSYGYPKHDAPRDSRGAFFIARSSKTRLDQYAQLAYLEARPFRRRAWPHPEIRWPDGRAIIQRFDGTMMPIRRKATRPSGRPRTPRPWLEEMFARHVLSREQAERIADKRYPDLSGREREDWIRARVAKVGLVQEDVAALTGWAQTNISRAIIGERGNMNIDLVDALCRELRVTREQIMFGSPQPEMRRILGTMLGDETIRMLPEEERTDLELNGYRGNIGPDVVAFRVIAEHHPRYDPGETLLCYEEKRSIEECIGRRCVVQLEDGRRYVGRVEPGASARLVTIRPWLESNPLQIDKTPVWISPIFSTIGPESKRT